MISDKTIELADKAKTLMDENTIHLCLKPVCYGYSQKLIELVLEECIEAIKKTDLSALTYTTFDKDRTESTIERVVKSVQSNFGK